jgi:putative ABC transport system permease protein
MNFKVGDVLSFDVQGVEIQGQIYSLRKVKWNSFQPNFFIQFQSGVLDQAPKTFLMSIPAMGDAQKTQLQNEMVKDFSNISMIDVHRTLEKIFDLADKMSWSLQMMALLSIFAGLIVLYSVSSHQVRARRWDINLFKIMGASPESLQLNLLFEFGLLGLTAAILGLLLSLLGTAALSQYLFEATPIFDLKMIPLTLLGVPALCLLVAWLAGRQVLSETPASLLQEARL